MVRHRNSDFLNALAIELRREFVVAQNPDFPDLINGPDLAAGRDGKLLAFFLPHQLEQNNPRRLQARLGLCRLALPRHTICVLVTDPANVGPRFKEAGLELDFHIVVTKSELKGSAAGLGDDERALSKPSIPTEVRQLAHARADFLFSISTDSIGEKLASDSDDEANEARSASDITDVAVGVPVPEGLRQSHPNPDRIRSTFPHFASMLRIEDRLCLVTRAANRPHSMADYLRSYIAPNFWLNFSLDNGVPFLTTWSASMLLTGPVSQARTDPFKALRAAALAGWVVIPGGTPASRIQQSMSQVNQWLARKTID